MQRRFEHSGRLVDLDEASSLRHRTVYPTSDRNKRRAVNYARYLIKKQSERPDQDIRALELRARSINLTPDLDSTGGSSSLARLSQLSRSLRTVFPLATPSLKANYWKTRLGGVELVEQVLVPGPSKQVISVPWAFVVKIYFGQKKRSKS